MNTGIFSSEKFAATRLPLDQASALPGWCYYSPEWHDREVETMFRKDWLCIGRTEQVPRPGDFYSIEIIGQPLIVARDDASNVRVHSAVCRHRGAVITQSAGNCRGFVCPYHSWTYSLEGRLVSTPGSPSPMADVKGFSRADYGLAPIRSDTWGGFIFISFDAEAPPLADWLGDLPGILPVDEVGAMQWKHCDVFELDCNWKVWVENAMESYHTWTVHRKQIGPVKDTYTWEYAKSNGPWEAMYSTSSLAARTGLPGKDNVEERAFHIWVRPNMKIIYTPSSMKFRLHLPEGPEKLRILENWAFPEDSAHAADTGSMVEQAFYKKYSDIIREDTGINANVQKGLRSGAYKPGRYAPTEHIVHRLANQVLDCVIGPDDFESRAARGAVNAMARGVR
jgi:choline monooxygenase